VAAEVAHHAHVLGFHVCLDAAPMSPVSSGADGGDARIIDSCVTSISRSARRGIARRVHAAGIAVPAVEDQRDVDIDDVAVRIGLSAGMPWQTT